jgi:hypothetical protein
MLSSSRSGSRLALVPRVYLASEGGVGTKLPLPLPLTLESPPSARNASRTSARRMFSAAVLAGERPREGSVANGTMTGGDMPTGSVGSSSFSATAAEKDGPGGCGDRRSTMPDQWRGSVCAEMYGLRAGVAGFRRKERGGTTWVCTVGLISRVSEGAGAGAGVGACTVSSTTTVVTLPTVRSASENISMEAEVDAGWGSARPNSRSSRSRRTRGDSSDMPQDGSVPGGSGVKEVSFATRVRAAVAAGVEETAACAGTKELSDGVRFGLNVSALNPDATDKSSGREDAWDSSMATPGEVSCREDRSSEVGMRTWAACS